MTTIMKSFRIEWDTLRNGQFPTEQMESCGLSVSVTKLSVFKQEIELTSTTDEDITPYLAFEIGCLVTASVYSNR